MFDVSEVTVKYWASEECYKKGIEYCESDRVHNVQIKKTFNSLYNANFININAEVAENNGENYEVFVLFNDKTGIVSVNCNCTDLNKKRKSDGICHHIAAVLIKYARDKENLIENSNEVSTKKFLNVLKKSLLDEKISGKPLNIDVKYEFSSSASRKSSIELRIGEDKLYVVKDLEQFLSVLIKRDRTIEYGKNFTYDANKYYIKEEDKKLIDFIKEIYINSTENFEGIVESINGKKLYLSSGNVRSFFKIIKNRTLDAVIDKKEYSSIKLKQMFPDLKMILNKGDGDIKISIDGDMPTFLDNNYDFIFYEGNIYNIDEEHKKAFAPFYEGLEKGKGKIKLSAEWSSEIASYVIPILNKLKVKLDINDDFKDKLMQVPLNAQIFLDKLDDCVIANIKFIYNNLIVNPLKKENVQKASKIYVRDIKKEINICKLFENYNFQKYGESYLNNSDEQVMEFLINGIEKLQDMAEIFYSNTFKNFKVYSSNAYKGGIKLNDEDLLEISFEIDGVEGGELKNIFEALKLKKKYYKLKKGGIVTLDNDNIKDMASLLNYLDVDYSELSKENITLKKYNAFYVDNVLNEGKLSFMDRSGEFKKVVSSVKEVKKLKISIPKEFSRIMRQYQKVGFKWFKTLSACGFGGILADEMGLGKTLQTIAFIADEIEEGVPSIVISPTSLVYNWREEIKKFSPTLKVLVISGTRQERIKLLETALEYDVILTSYPLIRHDIDEYKNISFKYCFLDEAQQIKNPNSINARSVKKIKAGNYFAITGTPMENSLTELWSIFDFIMPGYLLSHSKFVKKYEVPIVKDKDEGVLKELNKHIQPFILRRLKRDVIKELPPKIEHKVIIDMTEEQKKVYASYLANTRREIENSIRENGFLHSKFQILSLLTRLRQICCNPASFIDNYEGESGKLLALQDILEESINNNHRILIFSQFTTVLKDIAKMLQNDNIKYMYLDGNTKMENRLELVTDFNKGMGEVFLISLKAGGTGLNLTGADVVIHFDPWWNPAVEEQASDRVHRIGQKKTVEVIKLISRGTIEEKIYDLQQKKKEIIEDVINDKNSDKNILSKITEDELRDILA